MRAEAEKVILALDDPDVGRGKSLLGGLRGRLALVKVGPVWFGREGPDILGWLADHGLRVFLDLKLHDIPNTIREGLRAACASVVPAFFTVHASGGEAMLQAARETIDALPGRDKPKLLAVTVLTSFTPSDLEAVGVKGSLRGQVRRLAKLAIGSGADGLVCSPLEVPLLRKELGPSPLLVVPGIRLPDDPPDDQKRTATPGEAIRSGATHIVVGRPVTRAKNPGAALDRILDALKAG